MIKSPNQIRLELSEIATDHLQINSYFWGDFLRAYKESELQYPLMGAFYPSAGFLRNQTSIQLTVYVADKLYNSYSNLNEVESDTLQMCRDIFQIINSSVRWQSIGRVESCSVTKFIDKGGDGVAGHQMVFNFILRDRDGICNIPIENYDFDQIAGSVCYAAIVENSDASYQTTVASGGTLVVPNTSVVLKNSALTTISTTALPSAVSGNVTVPDTTDIIKDSSGATLYTNVIPSATTDNQTITDSTVVIKDSLGATLHTVTVVAQGTANKTISDSTAVVKNTLGTTLITEPILAQATEVITAPNGTAKNSDNTYSVAVPSGATVTMSDISFTDSNGVTTSVPSNKNITAALCSPSIPSFATKKLFKTMTTVSWRTDDDGNLERGLDFFTIDAINGTGTAIDGNTTRFLGTANTAVFTNGIIIDWSTFNGGTVLGIYKFDSSVTDYVSQETAVNALNTSGFTGWKIANAREVLHFAQLKGSGAFSWSPLSYPTSGSLYSSSLQSANSTYYFVAATASMDILTTLAPFLRIIPVRNFTLAELGL